MRHATPRHLDRLEGLLAALRENLGLREKVRGVFYLRSRAFLHFHQDGDRLFADIRKAGDWERYPVDTSVEQDTLVRQVRAHLLDKSAGAKP